MDSGSRRSPSAVDPVTSANRTVTVFRASTGGVYVGRPRVPGTPVQGGRPARIEPDERPPSRRRSRAMVGAWFRPNDGRCVMSTTLEDKQVRAIPSAPAPATEGARYRYAAITVCGIWVALAAASIWSPDLI